jgi:hypothetical protein
VVSQQRWISPLALLLKDPTIEKMELADKLVEYGAYINARDWLGRTRVSRAADLGNALSSESLIKRGADISIPDNEGVRPLDISHFISESPAGDKFNIDLEYLGSKPRWDRRTSAPGHADIASRIRRIAVTDSRIDIGDQKRFCKNTDSHTFLNNSRKSHFLWSNCHRFASFYGSNRLQPIGTVSRSLSGRRSSCLEGNRSYRAGCETGIILAVRIQTVRVN